MRRTPVTYRPEARDDLGDIFRYVLRASQSFVTAKAFVRRIKKRCDAIGDAPLGGRPCDDLEQGLRTVPFERSAVIAYKVEAKRVRLPMSSTVAAITKRSTDRRKSRLERIEGR